MDVHINNSGYWGPVTATLDWCEVRMSFPVAACLSLYVSPGQLPVLALRGGNLQHLLQPLLHLPIHIRRAFGFERVFSDSLSHRICCSSFCVHRLSLLPPTRYAVNLRGFSFQGCALIGLGSFCFHATLLYEAQLADELPMIYVASFFLAVLLESEPGFGFKSAYSKFLVAATVVFNVAFTAS
jgi:dihydroceramidase